MAKVVVEVVDVEVVGMVGRGLADRDMVDSVVGCMREVADCRGVAGVVGSEESVDMAWVGWEE